MLGCYKKTREEIANIIKNSPTTEDGIYFCKKFPMLNNKLGIKKEKGYIFDREEFKNKICFNNADIEAYLEREKSNYDIEKMKRKDIFLYNIIKDDIDCKLHKTIPNTRYTLSDLIDSSLFYFNYKNDL